MPVTTFAVTLAAAIVIAFGAFSAQATLWMLAPVPVRTPIARSVTVPAARATVQVIGASPAAGTTGTIALPPVPEGAVAGDAAVTAARPFALAGIATIDRARAIECLTAAIYYEAASESDDGQRAVAQVVLNRVRHPAFPGTVCGVVYQGSEHAGCQFSFACDGAATRMPARDGWARAARIAAAALNGRVFAGVGLATHYHTYAVTPAWNRTLVMTAAVGAHFFHRWKGYWGTAAAFGRHYAGGEPVPGAPPREDAVVTVSTAPAPVVAPVVERDAHAASGMPVVAVDASPDAQVLERWKDSGKPLR